MSTKHKIGLPPEEHERRFAPKKLPKSLGRLIQVSYIIQGYLEDEKRTRVRMECIGTKIEYTRTRKEGHGISRIEREIEIAEKTFQKRFAEAKCVLKKTRLMYEKGGIILELNLFFDELAGYFQIEIEFTSNKAARAFKPPKWLLPEVTHDSSHGNYSLSKFGRPKGY